jgi:pimeloyl-ACP methyl ester carboxylesterase
MAVLRREDGAEIHYAEHGSGFPVLALAPGGLGSAAEVWDRMPWQPVPELAGHYRVITMDQRNAGASTAPVTGTENWRTYTADQLALLDHLGVRHCHLVGMCIGGPFILGLLKAAPERFDRVVMLQPIGLDGDRRNREAFHEMFDAWARELAPRHPDTSARAWATYRAAMYGGDNALFSVPDSALPTIETPMLVLRGDDRYHPSGASELVAGSVPGARLVPRWREPEHLSSARTTIAEFLQG